MNVKCGFSQQRKAHRLMEFSNRLLRRIFGTKREGITASYKKLHKFRA
jgi:hypothetical protein